VGTVTGGERGSFAEWVPFVGVLTLGVLVVSVSANLAGYTVLGATGRFATGAVAFAAFGVLFLPSIRASTLTPRRVVVAVGVLVGVAVVVSPRGSGDVWSYVMYGRMLVVHGASPFTHGPAAFPRDPFTHLVAKNWRHTPSVYGPGFVALAGAGTGVAGHSALLNRLYFQAVEAAALAGALVLVWRRTRDPVALAVLGLNPAVLAVVNGGHNDLVVGLALLGGVLLALERRWAWAGVVLAVAASIKLVVVLPIAALVLWVWRRHGRRGAWRVAAACGAVLVLTYAAAGGMPALHALLHARRQHDQMSIWQLPRELLRSSGLGPVISTAALGSIAVLAGFVVLTALRRRARHPGPASAFELEPIVLIGATALVFLLAASFVLPWYSAWALPALALAWRSRIALLAVAQSAFVLLAYPSAVHATSGLVGDVLAGYTQVLVPFLSAATLAYLVWSAWRGRLADPVRGPAGAHLSTARSTASRASSSRPG
jgi:Glycosyltransferase family 87